MKLFPISIGIYDDDHRFFNEGLLDFARNAGFRRIDRKFYVCPNVANQLIKKPKDIIILDIKNVVDKRVALDGLAFASCLYKNTNSYVCITSSHQYQLRREFTDVDYIIENRLLTNVDFVEVLSEIVDQCLDTKKKTFQKIVFKIGFNLAKKSFAVA